MCRYCLKNNGKIHLYPARWKRLLRPLRSDNHVFILGQHKFTLMFSAQNTSKITKMKSICFVRQTCLQFDKCDLHAMGKVFNGTSRHFNTKGLRGVWELWLVLHNHFWKTYMNRNNRHEGITTMLKTSSKQSWCPQVLGTQSRMTPLF